MNVISFPLIDGSLVNWQQHRENLARLMAEDLVERDAWHTEGEAVRALYRTRKYKMGDIMALVDDVRQIAMQTLVAKEMGGS